MHRQRELDGASYITNLSSRKDFPDKHVLAAAAPTRRARRCDQVTITTIVGDPCDHWDRPVSFVPVVLRVDAWKSYDEATFQGHDERLR